MKKVIFLFLISVHFGCSDAADNPTAPVNYQTVPQQVLQVISNRCAFCHQPEKFSDVFKGQKPYFMNLLPDSSTTFLDTIQIWQSKERIGIRVVIEGTMPRTSDSTDFIFQLPAVQFDIISSWVQN